MSNYTRKITCNSMCLFDTDTAGASATSMPFDEDMLPCDGDEADIENVCETPEAKTGS